MSFQRSGHLVLVPVLFLMLACVATEPLKAIQVMSPSTAPNTHRKNMEAAGVINQQEQAQNVEPSRKLLLALDSMIPFDVVGSEIETPLQEATRNFLTGAAGKTVTQLQSLREQNPELPPVPTMMANLLYTIGNNQQGQQWLERSAIDFPEHPTAFLGFARFSVSQKRLADGDAMLAKVQGLIDNGNWTERQATAFRVEYLDILSDVYINRQQLDEAKACLLELKELLPDNGKVPVRLAQIEFDLSNVDDSLAYLNQAIEMNQAIRKPEVIVADWFMRKRNVEESEKWIKQAAGKYPEDVEVQIDFARWLLQNERLAEARAVISNVVKLGGNEYITGYIQGQIAFAQQAYEESERIFDQLLKVKPSDADATNMLALSLIESPDVTKHGRALELSMINQKMYPNSPTAMATLGWMHYRNGNNLEAEKAFRAVIASNNLAPVAAYYVATYLAQRGDLAGSKNLLDQALASQEYFMFRKAAADLLQEVEMKMPPPESNPDEAASDGSPPSDRDN